MALKKTRIIPSDISEYIGYDPISGTFFMIKSWRTGNRWKNHAGLLCPDKQGYVWISFKGTGYKAHRVAYFLMMREQPNEIDHINRIRDDNRWINLRSVTRAENQRNKGKYKKVQYPGVSWDKNVNKFRARLTHCVINHREKQSKFIGLFNTALEAYNAILDYAKTISGDAITLR